MGVSAYHDPKALSCAENASYYGQKMEIIHEVLIWYKDRYFETHEAKSFFKNNSWKGKPSDLLEVFNRRQNLKEFHTANSNRMSV